MNLQRVVPAVPALVALMVMNDSGELDGTELLILAVAGLVKHVTQHRVGHVGLHVLDLVEVVYCRRHPVLAERHQ